MCYFSTAYTVTIISDPFGVAVFGTDNAYQYFAETDLNLICMVNPTPPSDSEFSWGCSTGCFADMEMEQIVNVTDLEETDSGVLNCSVFINGVEYSSESFDLQVINGKKFFHNYFVHCSQIIFHGIDQTVYANRNLTIHVYNTFASYNTYHTKPYNF